MKQKIKANKKGNEVQIRNEKKLAKACEQAVEKYNQSKSLFETMTATIDTKDRN